MNVIGEILRDIGSDSTVVGIVAVVGILGGIELCVRFFARLFRLPRWGPDYADTSRWPKTRRLSSIHRRVSKVSPKSSQKLTHFIGMRVAGLAILLGGMAIYDAITAADNLRARIGGTPPIETLYATAFFASLEFLFGVALLVVAIGSAQKLKNWALVSAQRENRRPSHRISR